MSSHGQSIDDFSNNDTNFVRPVISQDSIKSNFRENKDSVFQQNGINSGNVASQEFKVSEDNLDAPIDYFSRDSFRIDMDERVIHLYGNAQVNYKEIELKAERIDFYWETGEVEAFGIYDEESGKWIGNPIFKESGTTYLAEHFRYNFKTKKGKSTGLVMKESEGFMHIAEIKSIGEDVIYGKKGRYTTCNLEDPHFYIEIQKMKILNDKIIVGKPANLVIEGVRTPVWLPFGLFPMIKERNSGFLTPDFSFNYDDQAGYGFKNLGVFWAISDKLGLTFKTDVWTHGNFSMYTKLDYAKRYKFKGSLSAVYNSVVTGERRDPNFAGPSRSLSFDWSLVVNPKILDNASFSIRSNFRTSGFGESIIGETDDRVQNTFGSSISYNKSWPGRPVRLSIAANHSQNTSTGTINLTVPSLDLNVSSINPFKGLGKTGKAKWYEDIYFTYNFSTRTDVNGIDSTFFQQETLESIRAGVRQRASVGTKIKLFKYINITPSFSYSEYWYPDALVKTYMDTVIVDSDTSLNVITEDQNYGFQTGRDFNLGASMGWKLYGTWYTKPEKNKRLEAFRHVVTPSISFNYRPDFSEDRWGFYETIPTNTEGGTTTYSKFQGAIYGGPGSGEQMNLNFSVTNNIEMKIRSKRDSTQASKKIRLLNGGRISASYNFARDSVRMSDISFSSGSTEIYKGIKINFSGAMTPYFIDPATNQTLDRWLFSETKRFFRLKSFRTNISANFQSKNRTGNTNAYSSSFEPIYEQDPYYADPYFGTQGQYVDFNIPWRIGTTYNMSLTKTYDDGRDTTKISHSARLDLSFSLTPKWNISGKMQYNITNREINGASMTVSRDLHCWNFYLTWQAVGSEYISFGINVNASQLNFLNQAKKSIPGGYTGFGTDSYGIPGL